MFPGVLVIAFNKCAFFSLKFTKNRLVAGLRPDPLGEFKCSPRPLYSGNMWATTKGRAGQGKEGEGEKGEREKGGGKEGKGEETGKKSEMEGRRGRREGRAAYSFY